jgi:hypothetical protein
MRRREFITLVGGTAATWPLAVRAQQRGKVAQIGFLGTASASGYARQVEGFRLGLHDLGYIEGTNVVIDYRDGNGYGCSLCGKSTWRSMGHDHVHAGTNEISRKFGKPFVFSLRPARWVSWHPIHRSAAGPVPGPGGPNGVQGC